MSRISARKYLKQLEGGTTEERAAALVLQCAMEDVSHVHRWYMDQLLRLLVPDGYYSCRSVFEDLAGEEWDEGIAT